MGIFQVRQWTFEKSKISAVDFGYVDPAESTRGPGGGDRATPLQEECTKLQEYREKDSDRKEN